MNWKVKSTLRHTALALPGGDKVYRWLTSELIGTQAGMAAKWFRVFPAHIRVLQENFGDAARAQRMWCYDSGATIAAGLAMAVATGEPGLLTERRKQLSDRYCETSRGVLREKGAHLAQLSQAPDNRVEEILQRTAGRKALPALAAVNMSYSTDHRLAQTDKWRGTIGCIYSAGTLEHYTPQQLEDEVAGMAAALRPGGVLSHVVDHRDHRWHADKTLSPLQHLTLTDGEYARQFNNPLDYHNRWLRSQWVELFLRHGFRVQTRDVNLYTDDLVPLQREKLAPEFQDAGEADLRSLVTHFVAVRE